MTGAGGQTGVGVVGSAEADVADAEVVADQVEHEIQVRANGGRHHLVGPVDPDVGQVEEVAHEVAVPGDLPNEVQGLHQTSTWAPRMKV